MGRRPNREIGVSRHSEASLTVFLKRCQRAVFAPDNQRGGTCNTGELERLRCRVQTVQLIKSDETQIRNSK